MKTILATVALAFASCTASATDYNSTFSSLDPAGDTISFGARVIGPINSLFSDNYSFTIGNQYDIGSGLTSTAVLNTAKTFDLNITSFGIRNTDTQATYAGTMQSTGNQDSWNVAVQNLVAGNYQLYVGGTVLGTGGGSYGGDFNMSPSVMVSAVPEPETYLMLLGGLLVVSVAVKRKRQIVDETVI